MSSLVDREQAKAASASPAVLVAQLGEAARHQVERVVPACRLELARGGVAHERRGQAVGRIDEVEAAGAALHAQKPLVRRPRRALRIHDTAVLHHEVQLAAHAAVRAGGAHALRLPRAVGAAALLHERARGARLRAVAARLAGARAPVRPERGLDGRARPALARAQRVVARGGVAGAHAALAADAQVRVVAQKRVAVQHGLLRARRRVRRALHAILAAEVGQLAGPILVA